MEEIKSSYYFPTKCALERVFVWVNHQMCSESRPGKAFLGMEFEIYYRSNRKCDDGLGLMIEYIPFHKHHSYCRSEWLQTSASCWYKQSSRVFFSTINNKFYFPFKTWSNLKSKIMGKSNGEKLLDFNKENTFNCFLDHCLEIFILLFGNVIKSPLKMAK